MEDEENARPNIQQLILSDIKIALCLLIKVDVRQDLSLKFLLEDRLFFKTSKLHVMPFSAITILTF